MKYTKICTCGREISKYSKTCRYCRPCSEETRKKLSLTSLGRKPNKQSIKKQIESRRRNGNYITSEETKQKISLSKKKWYQENKDSEIEKIRRLKLSATLKNLKVDPNIFNGNRNNLGRFLKKYNDEFYTHAPFCKCGCGKKTRHKSNGIFFKYIQGHNLRVNNPMKNKETKQKVSSKLRGRPSPFKGKKGHTAWNKGKQLDEKHKIRLRNLRLGKKSHRIGLTLEQEYGIEIAKTIKEKRAKQVIPMVDTKIEIKIQQFLRILGIEYLTHFYIKEIEHRYCCDIFIPIQEGILQKTIIECDGDFIHCNPKKYSADFVRFPKGEKITAKQIWEKDKIRTKELKEKGFRVIRLWGSEIKIMDVNKLKNILKL